MTDTTYNPYNVETTIPIVNVTATKEKTLRKIKNELTLVGNIEGAQKLWYQEQLKQHEECIQL